MLAGLASASDGNPQPLGAELAAVITPVSGSRALGGGQGWRPRVLRFDPPYGPRSEARALILPQTSPAPAAGPY